MWTSVCGFEVKFSIIEKDARTHRIHEDMYCAMPIIYCKSYLLGNFGVAISEITTPILKLLHHINIYWCLTRESLDLVRRLELGLLEQFTSNAVCHVAFNLKRLRKVL